MLAIGQTGPGGQTQEGSPGTGQARPTRLRLVWQFLSCPGDTFWHRWGRYLAFLVAITAFIPIVELYERHPRSVRAGRCTVLSCWVWIVLSVGLDRVLAKLTPLDWRLRQRIAVGISAAAMVGLVCLWQAVS